MSQESVETAKALMRHWSQGTDPGDLLDPEIEFTVNVPGGPFRGHEGALELFRLWRGAWASYEVTVDEIIDAGDHIVVSVREQGRGKTSGVDVSTHTAGVWTIRDGKAISYRVYTSLEDALEAVGFRN